MQFGRAARRLRVAQLSLSNAIKKLEEGIGATLFLRGRGGAEMTPAGRAFLPDAERLLQMRERAVQTTASVHTGIDLPLCFGYSPFIDHHLVKEVISGYRELMPTGRIEPSSECSARLVAMIEEEHLDAALVTMPIGEESLSVRRICAEKVLICLRQDDPLAREEDIPKHLVGDRLRILSQDLIIPCSMTSPHSSEQRHGEGSNAARPAGTHPRSSRSQGTRDRASQKLRRELG